MALIGVAIKAPGKDGGPDRTITEIRLDPDEPTRAVATVGGDLGSTPDWMNYGIHMMPGEIQIANRIGQPYGVVFPEAGSHVGIGVTSKTGMAFLVAVMAECARGGGYSWAEPILGEVGKP